MSKYNPSEIETKWQGLWEKAGLYEPNIKKAKNPYYNLWMFPYPSGARMHVGHAYASTGADIHGRFIRMQGKDVFQPMGFDAFGIHGENYAIKVGKQPKELIDELCRVYRDEQFKRMGCGYDWSHEVRTYDPAYYKWTQWLFLQLYKHGLAVRKKAPVNWCPSCNTVLANEQVIQGLCERCETQVEQKELMQWFFKITNYAEQLLRNLEKINWPERIKTMQKNWIGKSEGIDIRYTIAGSDKEVICFTTRPDTNFGATFVVLAPEHPLVPELTQKDYSVEVGQYIQAAREKNDIERVAEGREKTGVFTGSYAINDLTGRKMPIWVSDFVLINVGTGAVVGVPGHDIRDFEFAQKFELPVLRVVVGSDGDTSDIIRVAQVQEDVGTMINSGFLDGMDIHEATQRVMDYIEEKGWGKRDVRYRLRDWCISRQRYWGAPIPIIYCGKCGEVPVPDGDLPVLLPEVKNWQPTGTDQSPLAAINEFVNTTCPKCGGPAKRETDVCDNFLDSAWYYYAYPVFKKSKVKSQKSKVKEIEAASTAEDYPFQSRILKKWFPVDMYVGGAEHAVLHLMYTRFITMAFKDMGLIGFDEPFKTFFAHGLITKDGAKMSKSKGNVVNPDEYIDKVGADAFRVYLMFLGPYEGGGDFTDSGLQGMVRFLNRVWSMVTTACSSGPNDPNSPNDPKRIQLMHRTIKKVKEDIESFSFNTAIAALMEWVNQVKSMPRSVALRGEKLKVKSHKEEKSLEECSSAIYPPRLGEAGCALYKEEAEVLLKLLAPLAPHITEELWQAMSFANPRRSRATVGTTRQGSRDGFKKENSIHLQPWPEYDPDLVKTEEVTVVVQVNGKLRDKLVFLRGAGEREVHNKALESIVVQRFLQGQEIKHTVFVPDKLINFVV